MKRFVLPLLVLLTFGLIVCAIFIRMDERLSKHEHDWRMEHGRGLK